MTQVQTNAGLDPARTDFYRQLLHRMLLIRRFEEKAGEAYALGQIGGFSHLYIGQEAVAVGAMAALRDDDYVTSSYREHGHALARGMSARVVMAELFGKATGCSKGKGGSMHLFDADRNFLGGHARGDVGPIHFESARPGPDRLPVQRRFSGAGGAVSRAFSSGDLTRRNAVGVSRSG